MATQAIEINDLFEVLQSNEILVTEDGDVFKLANDWVVRITCDEEQGIEYDVLCMYEEQGSIVVEFDEWSTTEGKNYTVVYDVEDFVMFRAFIETDIMN